MPQANDYAILLGQARAVSIIADYERKGKIAVDPVTGCRKMTVGLRTDGYASIRRRSNAQLADAAAGRPVQRNSEVNFLMHRVAFLAMYGRDVQGTTSHLCENRACISHVWDEPHGENLARKSCIPDILCLVHGTLLREFCRHTPRCIKRPLYGRCCSGIRATKEESVHGDQRNEIPDSQESEAVLSDYQSMLRRDASELPGSQYLGVDDQDLEESADLGADVDLEIQTDGSATGDDEFAEVSMMETSLLSLSLRADEEMGEPSSSPPRLPTSRRSWPRPPPVLESSSPQPSLQGSDADGDSSHLHSIGSFVVDDDVVEYESPVSRANDEIDS